MGCHTFSLSYFTLVCLWSWRTVGCAVGRSVCGHEITKFCRMDRLPHFLSYRARRAWSSSVTTWPFIIISKVFVESHNCSPYSVHSVEAELESIFPLIAIWQKSAYKLELWRNTKKGTNILNGKPFFLNFSHPRSWKLHRFHAICKEKNKSVHRQRFYKPGKMPFFLSTNTERQILVKNNFQGANYVNLHDGSKTLKFEDIVRLKVMLHETIRNNDL